MSKQNPPKRTFAAQQVPLSVEIGGKRSAAGISQISFFSFFDWTSLHFLEGLRVGFVVVVVAAAVTTYLLPL